MASAKQMDDAGLDDEVLADMAARLDGRLVVGRPRKNLRKKFHKRLNLLKKRQKERSVALRSLGVEGGGRGITSRTAAAIDRVLLEGGDDGGGGGEGGGGGGGDHAAARAQVILDAKAAEQRGKVREEDRLRVQEAAAAAADAAEARRMLDKAKRDLTTEEHDALVKAFAKGPAGKLTEPALWLHVASCLAPRDLVAMAAACTGTVGVLSKGVVALPLLRRTPATEEDAAAELAAFVRIVAARNRFPSLRRVFVPRSIPWQARGRIKLDATVAALAKHCPGLTSLDVAYCGQLTDAALVAVAGNCPGLTSLNVTWCERLTDAALVAVAGNCPGLASLDVAYCRQLTDAALEAVKERCPGVTIKRR